VRNANLLYDALLGWLWAAILTAFAASQIGAVVALWIGAAAVVVALWFSYVWWRNYLAVGPDGVVVGSLLGARTILWADVDHFRIRSPERRTMFVLSFRRRADEGDVSW
jgi:hypothetical protein